MSRAFALAASRHGRLLVGILVVALLAATMTAVTLVSEAPTATAAVASDFDPGDIISDANFYASDSLTAAQVQAFLVAKEPTCRATTGPACLRSYTLTTASRVDPAGNCKAYPGGANQTAAAIIENVGAVCGISPKVLLVLLEKEQGLVSSTAPTAYMYRSATGYGCPDTAACDSTYYGFFNQVYMAALQFKRYAASPTYWAYQAGRTTNILYSPNAACGTKSVAISNQATASLYNYTPYTPDAAALSNLYGTGDSCSSYGNRNFWRLYTDWFGSTTAGTSPFGSVDSTVAGLAQVDVSGWAADPDTTDPIRVHVYIDGHGVAAVTAGTVRADLAGRLGANDTDHGFSTTIDGVAAGSHSVCTYAINVDAGSNTLLKCVTVTVLTGSPFGQVTQLTTAAGSATVAGWAIDPDVATSTSVTVTVDGKSKATLAAATTINGLDASHPGYGDAHGFSGTITGLAAGRHAVCVVAANIGKGSAAGLGCSTLTVQSGSPKLSTDTPKSPTPGTIVLSGWAIDFDTTAAVRIHVYVDGHGVTSLSADAARASLAKVYPGYGAAHAFTTTLTGLASGSHQVCIYAMNVGPGSNTHQCATVAGPTGPPSVAIQTAAATTLSAMTVSGWAVDPDTLAPIQVHLYVDGRGVKSLSAASADAASTAAFPTYGSSHGFTAQLGGFGPGSHTVCAFAMNVGGGSTTHTCTTVTMSTGSPLLTVDQSASPAAGTVAVGGWAIDPDTVAPLRVHVYVDGVGKSAVTADTVDSTLTSLYGAYGGDHRFAVSLGAIARGSHQVCLFAMNVGAGANTEVCKTVPVS